MFLKTDAAIELLGQFGKRSLDEYKIAEFSYILGHIEKMLNAQIKFAAFVGRGYFKVTY